MRRHIGRSGHVSCLTTSVKIFDFNSQTMLCGEDTRVTVMISGHGVSSDNDSTIVDPDPIILEF